MNRIIRALVVDDIEINLIVAQELLKSLSVEADLAGSGPTAIDMCKSRRYDIILMDHLMPEMDGVEAAKLIRAFTDTPIVAMTANEDPDAQKLFITEGFAGFLQKPVNLPQLSDMITRLAHTDPQAPAAHESSVGGGARSGPRRAADLSVIAEETGLDVRKSVEKLGGSETAYIKVLQLFACTGPEKIKHLEALLSSWNWKDFLITIHGQKSALANIGATALSEEARVIETAVKDGNHTLVEAVFSGFESRYMALCDTLRTLYPEKAVELRDMEEQDRARLSGILTQTERHINNLEHDEALECLAPMLDIRFGEPLSSGLAALRSAIGSYNYDGAAELIKRLSKGASQ